MNSDFFEDIEAYVIVKMATDGSIDLDLGYKGEITPDIKYDILRTTTDACDEQKIQMMQKGEIEGIEALISDLEEEAERQHEIKTQLMQLSALGQINPTITKDVDEIVEELSQLICVDYEEKE